MRKGLGAIVLLVALVLGVMDASAFRGEPDGFKGMSWGAPLGTTFSKDDFVGYSSDDKSQKYQKISDTATLDIDTVSLYSMVFSFYNDAFWKVELEARLLQAGKMLELLTDKFGEPTRVTSVSEFTNEYVWSGTVTDIILVTSLNFYDRKTADIATATMYSRNVKAAIDADDHALTERKLPIDAVDGFRGRKWGSGFSNKVTYLPLEQEPFYAYHIKDDDMVFEGVIAREIRYRFYNNKALQKVELYFSGKQNYLKVKEACFRLFGTTSRYERGEIRWVGAKTTATLSFFIDSGGTWHSRLDFFGYGSQ